MAVYAFGAYSASDIGVTPIGLAPTGTPITITGPGDTMQVSDLDAMFDDESTSAPETLDADGLQGLAAAYDSGAYSAGQYVESVYRWTVTNATTGETGSAYMIRIYTGSDQATKGMQDGEYHYAFTIPVTSGDVITLSNPDYNGQVPYDKLAPLGGPSDGIVSGTAGDDLIDASYVGDPEGDKVDAADNPAGTDDDIIHAGAGNDTVIAGLGDDNVDAGAGDDSVLGGEGRDTIVGGDGNDTIYGNEGDDLLFGNAGNDTIIGEFGDDTIDGGAGDDRLEGNEGNDLLLGGDGNDWMRGSYGNDTLIGGTGDDYLWGGYNDDLFIIENNFGNDTIDAESVDEKLGDTLDLSAVTDDLTIDLTHVNPEIGTFTDDVSKAEFDDIENIILGSGRNTLVLADFGGADVVRGFAAPTELRDGSYRGNDRLDTSSLHDANGAVLNTDDVVVSDDGSGNAVLTFPNGESLTLLGVAPAAVSNPAALAAMGIPMPDYVVQGTGGADLIDGSYIGDPQGDMVDDNDNQAGDNNDFINAGSGNDTVFAGAGDDNVVAGSGDDYIDGGFGNDTLSGDTGNNTLIGGLGDDMIWGGTGNDSIEGQYGNDRINTGMGDDFADGGEGADTFYTQDGFGNDTLVGGETGDDDDLLRSYITADSTLDLTAGGTGNDPESGTLTSGGGADVVHFTEIERIHLGSGNDTVIGSSGADSVLSGTGADVIMGGAGDDHFIVDDDAVADDGAVDTVIFGDGDGNDTVGGFEGPTDNGDGTFSGHDILDVSGMTDAGGNPVNVADVTVTDDGAGNAILTFPNGESVTLIGISPAMLANPAALVAMGIPDSVSGDGLVEGTAGADLIDAGYTGDPDGDMIDAADNTAGNDDDIVAAGAGNDTVYSGAGNDSIDGGEGDDLLFGGTGDDSLTGGAGADLLYGEAGNDVFSLGSGDTASGGDGDDVFNIGPSGLDGTALTLDGGEGDETLGDTLNITGPATIVYDPGSYESGTVTWLDGTTLTFSNIETVHYVPCFTPEVRIKTARGEVPAGEIRVGDRVLTRDNGYQTVRWAGQRTLAGETLRAAPHLCPIRIEKGALGRGRPERDMVLSPQHRVLVGNEKTTLWFGEEEVLVAAQHLCGMDGVSQVTPESVTYVHFMFDSHEIVSGDGVWSESFQPGDGVLQGMDTGQRDELFAVFPELQLGQGEAHYPAARVTLRAFEAALVL